jgi:hypothetical protein
VTELFLEANLEGRPLRHEGLCFGTGVDFVAMNSMGIAFENLGVADLKATSRTFCEANYRGQFKHFFRRNDDLSRGSGVCSVHGGKDCEVSSLSPDVSTGGLPCQPFTRLRQQSGITKKTGSVQNHPLFEASNSGIHSYDEAGCVTKHSISE